MRPLIALIKDRHCSVGRCERSGEETVGERDVIAYRAVSTSGREFFGWIDPMLKFPLRIKRRTAP